MVCLRPAIAAWVLSKCSNVNQLLHEPPAENYTRNEAHHARAYSPFQTLQLQPSQPSSHHHPRRQHSTTLMCIRRTPAWCPWYTTDIATLLGMITSKVPFPAAFIGLRHSVKNHKARNTRPRAHALIVFLEGQSSTRAGRFTLNFTLKVFELSLSFYCI